MAIPELEARRKYLAGVEKKRGKAAADRLRSDIAALWARK